MRKFKAVFITLTLLTFLGQSVASVASPCQMLASGDMTAMDMSQMPMPGSGLEMSMIDCCDSQCQCVIGGCTALIMLGDVVLPYVDLALSNTFAQPMPGATVWFSSSLYRPPSSR